MAYIKFDENPVLTHRDVLLVYVLTFGALLFLICSLMFLKKLFNKKPEILVGNDGIFLQDYGYFKWNEIKNIAVAEMNGHRYFGISVNDPKKLEEKLNLFRKILFKGNSYYSRADIHIYISLSTLIISQHDIENINKIRIQNSSI